MHPRRIYLWNNSYILMIIWSHEEQQDMRVYLYYITYVATHGFVKENKTSKKER